MYCIEDCTLTALLGIMCTGPISTFGSSAWHPFCLPRNDPANLRDDHLTHGPDFPVCVEAPHRLRVSEMRRMLRPPMTLLAYLLEIPPRGSGRGCEIVPLPLSCPSSAQARKSYTLPSTNSQCYSFAVFGCAPIFCYDNTTTCLKRNVGTNI